MCAMMQKLRVNSIAMKAALCERDQKRSTTWRTYRLKDLDSTNGTKVNGVPITETALRFEDRIRFGAIEARFELDVRGSQPLPQREIIEAKPAESSAAPSGFGNASPFRQRSTSRDPLRLVVLSMAAIALLTFLGSMLAVLLM